MEFWLVGFGVLCFVGFVWLLGFGFVGVLVVVFWCGLGFFWFCLFSSFGFLPHTSF